MTQTKELLRRVKAASRLARELTEERVNEVLSLMADALEDDREAILSANAEDLEEAKGLSPAMLDRLALTPERISDMARGIRALIPLDAPFGRCIGEYLRPNGLVITKMTVPLGAVGIIYESRPNVTSDAAALAVKSGNAVLLRTGKEAWKSANAIVTALRRALRTANCPEDLILLVEDRSRASAEEMMKAKGYLDLLIPRGGKALIRTCVEQATVPCIETGTGICHIYVDKAARTDMALSILDNAKTSRPSVCNAAEVLLVHRAIAESFLPLVWKRLVEQRREKGLPPVSLRCDERARAILPDSERASDTDFDTEFLDLILAVRVVDSLDGALMHIAAHSTGHSEAIVTEDESAAERFLSGVDAAAVYHNASTRFTDGGEFGLGCEMGISTQKLHARGPFGLEALVSYQYRIKGSGQIR